MLFSIVINRRAEARQHALSNLELIELRLRTRNHGLKLRDSLFDPLCIAKLAHGDPPAVAPIALRPRVRQLKCRPICKTAEIAR